MSQQLISLHSLPVDEIIERIRDSIPFFHYDPKRHVIELQDEHQEPLGYVRLPLNYQLDGQLEIVNEEAIILYLSIESGNAALVLMEGDSNLYHTTFSAYMTRKKQGFSQVKYLKKKGKSRAGSRVRLAETTSFFEKIDATVTEVMEEDELDRLALGCSKTLIPYLFQSKIPFPMDKGDDRLYKIPLHIPQSNFTNLEEAINKLKRPVLLYQNDCRDTLIDLLGLE